MRKGGGSSPDLTSRLMVVRLESIRRAKVLILTASGSISARRDIGCSKVSHAQPRPYHSMTDHKISTLRASKCSHHFVTLKVCASYTCERRLPSPRGPSP